MNEHDEHDGQTGRRRRRWNTDATADYPVGPDDAGNVVMHAVGFLASGWRWLTGTFRRRS